MLKIGKKPLSRGKEHLLEKSVLKVPLPTENIDIKTLEVYCKAAEELMGNVDSLDDIKLFLKKEFNVDCSIEDLEKVYALEISMEEAELLYKQYGYEKES